MMTFLIILLSISFVLNLVFYFGLIIAAEELKRRNQVTQMFKKELDSGLDTMKSLYATIAALKRKLRSQRATRKFKEISNEIQ